MVESLEKEVVDWTNNDVLNWLQNEDLYDDMKDFCVSEELDGKCLLSLVEQDFYNPPFSALTLRKRKRFTFSLRKLQNANKKLMHSNGLSNDNGAKNLIWDTDCFRNTRVILSPHSEYESHFYESDPSSMEVKAPSLKPEIFKAFVSMCYVFLVTWVTAVVMVIVHDKVPDMKKYPPLPDLFLDNVPHIPWAFDMCEITGSILMAIWVAMLLFHKQRFIIMRRFFALAGTVFLLRCITMLITSLSVPGSHLKCAPRSYPSADELSHWGRRLQQAYEIWSGAGMSVRGVRTCGDYMFSGHTVILTLLNFFITEYTSRSLYLLHIITWVMNMFGIFFILAAHEHYSIDVFIAFYITSRLFLYYHTLSNNQALMRGDSMRTKIWFPLLTYFESDVNGIVPNEYESPLVLLRIARDSLLQSLHGLCKSSTVKMVNTKLSDSADHAVFKFVDGIKNHIIVTSTLSRLASRNLKDKDIQVSLPEDMCIQENIPTTVKKKIS